MSSSIEWGSAAHCTAYVLGHTEEAGDHQSVSDDSENPEEVGLMFDAGGDGYCLTGTPAQIIATLTQAITAVATYRPETEEDGAIAEAKAQALEEAAQDFEDNMGVTEFDEWARRDGARWGHIEEAWEHQGPYMDWLRARAATVRGEA